MALEFHKVTGQIESMARYFAEREIDNEDKIRIALEILREFAGEARLPEIDQRVQDAIDRDAGYRGARPLDEPIMDTYPPGDLPESATLVAVDGSQIYPRRHEAAQYYLLNIAAIIFHYGSGLAPEIVNTPTLFFDEEHFPGGSVTNATINARRAVDEMAALSEQVFYHRDQARPLLAMLDGPLLFMMGNEVSARAPLRNLYFDAMRNLHQNSALLSGYISKPDSTFLVRMLHLLDTPEEEVRRTTLKYNGRIEGLKDVQIFGHYLEEERRFLLPAGHRSALFTQMSPQNKEFKQRGGDDLEITFFYINTAAPGESPRIARVEVPMWVAVNKEHVAEIHVLIYQQCQQITKRYPYVLMRADELAAVLGKEQHQFDTMVKVSMSRYGLKTEASEKQASKNIARAGKSSHEI